MHPPPQCCHHLPCPARGPVGQGNMRVPSHIEPRSRGPLGGQPFAATKGPPCDRLRTAAALVPTVLTLLGHGCPLQAIVAALGLDERPVASWRLRAGQHCQPVQQAVVPRGQIDLPHVQADELGVKRVGRRVGMAMALAVPSRRWLGGVISPHRDLPRITARVQRVRTCARPRRSWAAAMG